MLRKMTVAVLVALGLSLAAGAGVAAADQPGMTHDSPTPSMTHD